MVAHKRRTSRSPSQCSVRHTQAHCGLTSEASIAWNRYSIRSSCSCGNERCKEREQYSSVTHHPKTLRFEFGSPISASGTVFSPMAGAASAFLCCLQEAALRDAAFRGDLEVVASLLAEGVNVNAADSVRALRRALGVPASEGRLCAVAHRHCVASARSMCLLLSQRDIMPTVWRGMQ
jgi:hypothetical protein